MFLVDVKTKRHLKPNTYFLYVARLKTFFKKYNAVLYVWMKENIKAKMEEVETEALTREQLYALVEDFKTHSTPKRMMIVWEAVHWFLAANGPRLGETCALNVGDVSFKDGLFTIRFRPSTTKTKKPRAVYLERSSYAGAIFHNYFKSRQGSPDNAPLWVGRDGNRLREDQVERKYREARQRLGIKCRCTPHVLRHTYISFMRHRKIPVPVEDVAAVTGHNKVTLMKTYSQVSEETKMDNARKYQIV